LLGLFPGGLTDSDLNQLWSAIEKRRGSEAKDCILLLEILKQYSLVIEKLEQKNDRSKTKFMLSVPIMNIYAVSLLSSQQMQLMQEQIVRFFVQILRDLFNDI